ncbi:MAG: sigma-70 family RNA polymerase sigma factor [Actinomycetota bacterium]|nr:sigma-70 family RNA polymerase sigma factor [Actinomycetota bacterium]
MVIPAGGEGVEQFAQRVRPRLVRALVGSCGVDRAADAASEALAYAFEHWERVRTLENPEGYLYRVAQSRSRERRRPSLPSPVEVGLPDIEPALIATLLRLPLTQRTAVWLVHDCGWTYRETAEAMHTSPSMVGNHLSRGLATLRRELGVEADV